MLEKYRIFGLFLGILILLFFGIVAVRQKRKRAQFSLDPCGFTNMIDDSDADILSPPRKIACEPPSSQVLHTPRDDDFVVINILPNNSRFRGAEVLKTLLDNQFCFAEEGLFHVYENCQHNKQQPLFSVAHSEQPITFELATMEQADYKGLTLFLKIAKRTDDKAVFNQFIATADRIAKQLNGKLCNQTFAPLTQADLYSYLKQLQEGVSVA